MRRSLINPVATTTGAHSSAPVVSRRWRLIILTSMCTAACIRPLGGTPADSTGELSSVQPAQNGVVVTVAADHDTVPAGAPLRVTVTVKNNTTSARTLSFTSGCATDYELLDATSAVTAASDQMCTQAMTNRTLAAGDTFADVHVLLRGRPGMPVVPPGAYKLRGVLLLAGTPVRSAAIPIQFR